MSTRRLSLAAAAGILAALAPHVALAKMTWIYCGNLPGCNASEVQSYVGNVLAMLLIELPKFVYLLGGLFIVIGGMYIVLSAGNSENVTKGKNIITWSAIGIFAMEVIVTMSPLNSFLKPELAPLFAPDGTLLTTVQGTNLPPALIQIVVSTIIDLLYVALLGVGIFSGMRMVMSGGKDDQYNKGKEGLFWAAVGAIIINIADVIRNAFTNI